MGVKLKKLGEQVMVITGATSGIGLATARMAAAEGVKVLLAGRSSGSLGKVEQTIRSHGGIAHTVEADVSKEKDVERIAEAARERFGGFDTWVNNAGVGLYGRALDVSIEDHRQLFDINYWGVVYGSRVACDHLRQRGGALINLGSVVSDRAVPLQGTYSATKAAVKAFTDAVRMELEEEEAPVSVTLIQPTSIDTPFPEHAKSYLEEQPTLPSPIYAPHTVAEAILKAAVKPIRNVLVGGGAKAISAMGRYAPRATDLYMESTMFDEQKRTTPTARKESLWDPSEDPRERGESEKRVKETSLYTKAALNPVATAALAVGAGLAVAALMAGGRRET